MKKMKLGLTACAVALGCAASTAANAAEFVTNGGFENAAPTFGWTFSEWNTDTGGGINSNSGLNAASSRCFEAACADPDDVSAKFIAQAISGLSAGSYTLSIAGNTGPGNDPSTINGLKVYFDDLLVLDQTNVAPVLGSNVWNTFTSTFAVTGTSGVLKVLAYSSGNYHVDDVSVTDVSGGVPEPATWALMLAGFGVVGSVVRRHRRAPAGAM